MGAFDQRLAARLVPPGEVLPWLAVQRAQALDAWLACALPTRRTEAWKYTGIEALAEQDYLRAPAAHAVGAAAAALPAFDAIRLVFVNGRFDPALSDTDGADAFVCRFGMADEARRAIIAAHLGSAATHAENPFVALNGCLLEDGVLVHVPRGARPPRPIHIVHLAAPDAAPFAYAQRLLVVLEESAEAAVVEHFAGTSESRSFASGTTELVLGAGSRLDHVRLHLEHEGDIHVGGVFARIGAAAVLDCFLLGLGGKLKRLDYRACHQGEGSEYRMNGIYLARRAQHLDLHSSVEHEQPRGSTQQTVRGIAGDTARCTFNGRIHIHRHAQKTSAHLQNRNLLLHNTAEINTKPELEIWADDVACSHGATVSQIDANALYYLRSRGIDSERAGQLLAFGFLNELVERMPVAGMADHLRTVLTEWL